jgi:hypothetical protein
VDLVLGICPGAICTSINGLQPVDLFVAKTIGWSDEHNMCSSDQFFCTIGWF